MKSKTNHAIETITSLKSNALFGSEHGIILYLMHKTTRQVLAHFDVLLAHIGITQTQWWALEHISRFTGETQIDVAKHMGLGRAAAGKMFEKLEALAFITRMDDPNDKRIKRLHLTTLGKEALDKTVPIRLRMYEKYFENITPEEIAVLNTVTRKLSENCEDLKDVRGI